MLHELRSGGCRTPVLLLTAKAEVEDRILGLDMGADDYLPKPFAMGELLARVRAMLRRGEVYTPDVLSFGDLELDRGGSFSAPFQAQSRLRGWNTVCLRP